MCKGTVSVRAGFPQGGWGGPLGGDNATLSGSVSSWRGDLLHTGCSKNI